MAVLDRHLCPAGPIGLCIKPGECDRFYSRAQLDPSAIDGHASDRAGEHRYLILTHEGEVYRKTTLFLTEG